MLGDLRPAAVHDDRVDARLLQVDDVLREGVRKLGVAHGVAAELHDDGLLVVANEVRNGFGQDARLQVRASAVLQRERHRFPAEVFR